MKRKKGQSILEYVIVLTVIIAAIIAVAVGAFKPAVQQTLNDSAIIVSNSSSRLATKHL